MLPKRIKNIPLPYKLAALGLVLVLLMIVLSCGSFQAVSHSGGATAMDCQGIVPLASMGHTINRDNVIDALLLLSLVVLFVLIRNTVSRRQDVDTSLRNSFVLIKVGQFISKLYNPILKAFRRGIIHTQIYNFAQVTD